MIRVKAIDIKDLSHMLITIFLKIFILYILSQLLINYINNLSNSFDNRVLEEYIDNGKAIYSSTVDTLLINKELNVSYSIGKKRTSPQVEIQVPQNENSFVYNAKDISFERPIKYEVEELPSGKIRVGNIYINNYSKLSLDFNDLSKVSDFKISDATSFLIFHTHTSEAYEDTGIEGNFRTTDDNYNVVSVGKALKENLTDKGFTVYHEITKHDTPSYNGAYSSSLKTVEKALKLRNYNIIIDLHRDALSGNLHFRPTTLLNGESAAKLMFVVGTNASGLEHPNWINNLKLAVLIQNTAEKMYPRVI